MRLNRIAAVFYCLIKCRLVQSRQNFRVIASASVAIPLNNRQSGNIFVSDLIAPLKKAQRKSEGGQLFPESVFPLRATPFPKTPQKPPTTLIFKGVSVI